MRRLLSTKSELCQPVPHCSRIHMKLLSLPLTAALFLTVTQVVFGAGGSIDPTFPPTNVGFGILKIALQSDSRILVAGTTHFDASVSPTNILRLKTDGTIDPTFPATRLAGALVIPGFTNAVAIYALTTQSDDQILLGGNFGLVNGVAHTHLVRLSANGNVDSSFNAAPNDSVLSILPLAGGKYLIGGTFKQVGSAARKNIARLNADGAADPTFNPNWVTPLLGGPINALALQPDGKILAGGSITTFSGAVGAVGIVRFNTDGTLDSTFKAPAFPFLGQNVGAIVLQKDGSIILQGLFGALNGVARSDIARLSSDGAVDPAWGGAGAQGNGLTDHAKAMLLQPDGRIVLGGTFARFSDTNLKGFVRLNAGGTIDSSLNYTDGSTTWVTAMALQQDGKIVAGGTFTLGTETFTLLRILGDGAGGSTAPVISTQPIGQTVTGGARVPLSVVATGGATLTYQWYHEGVAIPGATFSTLSLVGIKPEQAGSYYVVVTHGSLSTQSDSALIVVNSKPSITTHPVAQSVAAGETAKFSVLASGTEPLTYQWQFNGAPLLNETSSTLTLQNVQPEQAGAYTVVVHNGLGDTTSDSAVLKVTIAPPVITTQPQSQIIISDWVAAPNCTNLTGRNLQGAVLAMSVLDGATPFEKSGHYTITLGASAHDISANGIDAASSGTWTFGADLGISTVLTATKYFGDSRLVHWALLPNCEYELYADGLVSSQHGTYSVSGGTTSAVPNVTFSVVASGVAPLKYEWQHDTVPIPGVTSSAYTAPATPERAGTYTVLVSNAGGSTLSDPATLTISSSIARPTLTFSADFSGLTLTWPSGYNLQATDSISQPSWSLIGTASPQTLAFTGHQRFFRLVATAGGREVQPPQPTSR
jgi:uncharacterized delta-60 repeat protein